MKNNIEYYDIGQATTICGYRSIYMIDYLCREELIEPVADLGRGRGRKRYFSFQDLLILKLYRKLFDAGVSVRRLKQALKESDDLRTLDASRTKLVFGRRGLQANVFFTDGKTIYIREKRQHFIEAGSKGQLVFSFMVSLEDLHSELSLDTRDLDVYRTRSDGQTFYKEERAVTQRR